LEIQILLMVLDLLWHVVRKFCCGGGDTLLVNGVVCSCPDAKGVAADAPVAMMDA
jgi:hypothetical protein